MIQYGFIAWFLERFFYSLGFITSGWFLGIRIHTTEETGVRRRALRVDTFIAGCVLIETALVLALPVVRAAPKWLVLLIVIFSVWRLADIIQCHTNMLIFDHLRRATGRRTASVTRNLINSFIGYIEIIMLFSVLYGLRLHELSGAGSAYNALYFSVISQLTIGYGDIHPIHVAKALAMAQGLVGFFYGLLILGKIVSLIPTMYGRAESPNNGTQEPQQAESTASVKATPSASSTVR